jgi:hypothetical protein
MVTLEFFYCSPNCILVYPSFDYKDIRIDAMSCRKKGVDVFKNQGTDQQKSKRQLGETELTNHTLKAV